MVVPGTFNPSPCLFLELRSFLHPFLCLLSRHGRRAEHHHPGLDWRVGSVADL